MDINKEFYDTENALRDFIASILYAELGPNWTDQCGTSPERIAKWRDRKQVEVKRQEAGVVEERLLYYADFYDLKTILKKHWELFAPALGDWKTMEVFLCEIEKLRDPDAHRRDLLPHQKHLVLGIGGEIRTRLVRYRSKQETSEDYFPRIESVRDSLGNIWTPKERSKSPVITKHLLRPGDKIEYVVTATDPQGGDLKYSLNVKLVSVVPWQAASTLTLNIKDEHIADPFAVDIVVQSGRPYHAMHDIDDRVTFYYSVLPPRSLNS